MDLIELFGVLALLGLLAVLLFCCLVYVTSQTYPKLLYFEQEQYFYDHKTKSRQRFPSLDDAASVSLTVVVPAYNEEARLPTMLDECTEYLSSRRKADPSFSYEILVVDDGSSDKTTAVALEYAAKGGCDDGAELRVLTLALNRGKGGAVRMGMLRGRGRRLLFADADGATAFKDVEKLEAAMDVGVAAAADGAAAAAADEDVPALVCGSRAHLEEASIAQRSLFRTILMYGFHTCVRLFGSKTVQDTQCGFKLLTRPAARICFNALHIDRWAFDVEVIKIAEALSMPTAEVAVQWTEIEGSKLNPIVDAIKMFKDLFLLWLRYQIGAWKIREKSQ